jgi:ubiquinone/menaquinone biosynthesis C-methylase UbiE
VGVGSGFVSREISEEGIDVATVDVDARLNPTFVGSIRALPLQSKSVDVALCCQVLEHLPFSELETCLSELLRVATTGLVLSVPDQTPCFRALATTPYRHLFSIVREAPKLVSPSGAVIGREHFWEIGANEMKVEHFTAAIEGAGARGYHTYRVFENPYHRFFVIRV